jgi:hypothetical protein
MKVVETAAFVVGPAAFTIGAGMTLLYGLASYNQKSLATAQILASLGLIVAGWLLTKYVMKKTGRSLIHILIDWL